MAVLRSQTPFGRQMCLCVSVQPIGNATHKGTAPAITVESSCHPIGAADVQP